MRVFIGIKIDSELIRRINPYVTNLKKIILARYVKPKYLHITLIPPFYIENPEIDNLVENIKFALANSHQFAINFNKIELGPRKKHPRLIWISGKPSEHFIQIKNSLLKTLKIIDKHKSSIPHITLARFKKREIVKTKLNNNININFTVKKILLMESILSKRGAEYKKIFSYKLEK